MVAMKNDEDLRDKLADRMYKRCSIAQLAP